MVMRRHGGGVGASRNFIGCTKNKTETILFKMCRVTCSRTMKEKQTQLTHQIKKRYERKMKKKKHERYNFKDIQRILLKDKEVQYSVCSVSRMRIKKSGDDRIKKQTGIQMGFKGVGSIYARAVNNERYFRGTMQTVY